MPLKKKCYYVKFRMRAFNNEDLFKPSVKPRKPSSVIKGQLFVKKINKQTDFTPRKQVPDFVKRTRFSSFRPDL